MPLFLLLDITSSDTDDLDSVGLLHNVGPQKKCLFVNNITDLIRQANKYQKAVVLTVGSRYFLRF